MSASDASVGLDANDAPTGVERSTFAFSSLRAARRLVLVFALSRGLGLLRETGIAAFFGTSASADRLAAAFVISSFAITAVSEAVGAAALRKLSVDRSSGHSLRVWAIRWAPAAMLAYIAISAPLAALLTSGDGGSRWMGPLLAVALTPCVATAMLAAVTAAALTLEGRIGRVNASQACWSAGALLGIGLVAAGWHSTVAVALGWSGGNLVGLLVLWRAVDFSGPLRKLEMSKLLGPSLAVASAYSLLAVQGITDRLIASRLRTGAIAGLSYADRLHLVPVGFILAVYGPAVLGDLMNGRQDAPAAAAQSVSHMRRLVLVAAPCALAGIALAPQILRLVLGHGQFGTGSQRLSLGALDGLMSGIVATSLSLTLLRVTQALGASRRLPLITGISVTANLLVSLALSFPLGIAGIALGTSLAAMLTAALQVRLLAVQLGASWAHDVRHSCLWPATLVLVTGAVVTVLSYEGSIGAGRLAICLCALLALLAGERGAARARK